MPTVSNSIRIQDINIALVAHEKHQAGDTLNSKEKQAVNSFSSLYKAIADDGVNPSIKSALKGVLQGSDQAKVPDNALLTQHLSSLRTKSSATDEEVAQIKKFAARLSQSEDNAISTTLAELALDGGISANAVKDISGYLDGERASRQNFVRNRKLLGVGIAASTIVGGALAGPLVLWIPAVTTAVASMASSAATAVSLGALIGGAVTGGAAGKLASGGLRGAANNYGVND